MRDPSDYLDRVIIIGMFTAVAALALMRPTPLHVEGNRLVEDGRPVVLQGVNVPGFEASDQGDYVFRSCRVAIEDWHANCLRLPVSEDLWFGRADNQKDRGAGYREQVNEVVDLATNRDRYIILDLHSSDAGVWGQHLGAHNMPDEHSVQFWKDIAVKYRGLPHVLFGLYGEPHDVSWSVWKDGGEVLETDVHYKAPGMQSLLDAIRKSGAKNVCVAGGLDSAYDLTGVLSGFGLADPEGRGVVYDAHIYPSRIDWEGKVGSVCSLVPVIVGECGCKSTDPADYVVKLYAFIGKYSLSWTAWGMSPTAKPALVSDWVYTPTAFWGAYVKARLAGAKLDTGSN